MDSYDGVENLRLGEAPDPEPGPNQVSLRVRFAALNPADAFLAQAMYPAKPALPHILGRDGVGEVVAVGPGVSNVKAGDTVGILRCDCGVEAWGTLAEKVLVDGAERRSASCGLVLGTDGRGSSGLLDGVASPHTVDRPASATCSGIGTASDRRFGRRRHGIGATRQVDGPDGGGVIAQRRERRQAAGAGS